MTRRTHPMVGRGADPLGGLANARAQEIADAGADEALLAANLLARRDENGQSVLDRVRAAHVGLPAGRGFDGGSPGGELWCWAHQRTVNGPDGCIAAGDLCDGERVDHVDPVGEAAQVPDRAAADLRAIEADLRQLRTVSRRLSGRLLRYEPRHPTPMEKKAVEKDNEPACACCARIEVWSPVHRNGDVAGNLPAPMALCQWDYQFVRRTGRLPSIQEARRHALGLRVLLPAGEVA